MSGRNLYSGGDGEEPTLVEREVSDTGSGLSTPRSASQRMARYERAAGSFALEEALFLAQSRAREAEEAMSTYDQRMEEAVLRALNMLDESRLRERHAITRLQEIKLQILQHERLCEDAEARRRDGGVGHGLAAKGPLSDPSLIPSLHPALDPSHEADEAGERWQECDDAWLQERMDTLSESLAQAYEDVREAKEVTTRHTMLIEGLETVVEPILEYRHRGKLVDPSPPLKDESQASFEGSSVVFVQKSDAAEEGGGAGGGSETCFSLLAGKLAAVEDAKSCRAVLQKVHAMLEQAEEQCSASGSRATDARKRLPQVFDKVNGLIDLVRQQQAEIAELKSALKTSQHAAPDDTPTPAAPPMHTMAAPTPMAAHPPPPPDRQTGTPMQKRKRARHSYVAGTIPGRVIVASAASARQLIDMWEQLMLQSLTGLVGLISKLLGWIRPPTLLDSLSRCKSAHEQLGGKPPAWQIRGDAAVSSC